MTTEKIPKPRKSRKTADDEASTESEVSMQSAEADGVAGAMEAIQNADAAEPHDAEETAEDTHADDFQIVTAWPALTAEDAKAVSEFWRSENAIDDSVDAARRLTQVVLFARAATGEVTGVCTAVPRIPPRFGQPMYYWRAFIGKAWRASHPHLAMTLLKRSCAVLEAYARARDFPCIGVLLELENARFSEILRKPVWWNPPFCYAGKSGRGLDVRILYFHGARLKNAADIEKLFSPAD